MSSPADTRPTRAARRIDRRQRQELRVAFEIARGQIRRGHSLNMALTQCALGADDMRPRLAKRGVKACPNTVRADLGEPVGQLVKSAPGKEYGHALTYNLIEMSQRFGRLGQNLLAEFTVWALNRVD